MSILGTITKDGIKAALSAIPAPWMFGGAAILVISAVIGGKVWFHNLVERQAQTEINAYISKDQKEEKAITDALTADNARLRDQLAQQRQVITHTIIKNHTIIQTVPDVNTILSDGWISAFNASVQGLDIDPALASVKTPSGINADQALDTINTNNGICLTNLAQLTAVQQFIKDQQAAVAAANKKKP